MKKIKLLFAGLSVFAVGAAVVHAKTNSQIKTDDLNPFTSIDTNVKTSDIKIIKGDKFKIEINLRRPEEEIKYNIKDNKLMIKSESHKEIFSIFGAKKYNVITVYVPKIDDVSLNTNSGDIFVDGLKINEVSASTTSGDVNLSDVEMQKVNVNTTSGDVNLSEANAKDIIIACNSGDVEANLSKLYNINLKIGSGTINIDGKRYEREYIKNNVSDSNINVKVGSGDIKITHEFVKAKTTF